MSPRAPVVPVALLLALAIAVLAPAAQATPFHRYGGYTGDVSDNSCLVDAAGTLHILSRINGEHALGYQHRAGDQWQLEYILTTGDVGYSPKLVQDAHGTLHAAFYDNAGKNVMHAERRGANNWFVETVESTGDVGQYIGFATDGFNLGIAYYDATNGDLRFAAGTTGSWTTGSVETSGDIGAYVSLAVDDLGQFHASYFDATNRRLKYAFRNIGGTWTPEVVDAPASATVGQYTSIAIDPLTSKPAIAYYDAYNGDLWLATRPSVSWVTEAVNQTNRVGRFASLRISATGVPCVAYYDSTNKDLLYSTKSGSWQTEIVDGTTGTTGDDVGSGASLVLDPNDLPVIVYLNSTGAAVRIADARVVLTSPVGGEHWVAGEPVNVTWQGLGIVKVEFSTDGGTTFDTMLNSASSGLATFPAPWTETDQARIRITRATPLSVSQSPGVFAIGQVPQQRWWSEHVLTSHDPYQSDLSLKLDAHQTPVIAFHNVTNDTITVARRSGVNWLVEPLERGGSKVSLAFDGQNVPHVAYRNTAKRLRHAWKTAPTIWSFETVGNDSCDFPQIAVDRAGNISIAYQEIGSSDLKFARKTPSGWTVDPTVDGTGSTGHAPHLALDGLGDPHILYFRKTPNQTLYAHKSNGAWATETIETVNTVSLTSQQSSGGIAITPEGQPAVVYQATDSLTTLGLYYATREEDGWQTELITTADGALGVNGGDAFGSLAIGADGIPHVSYYTSYLEHAFKRGGRWDIVDVDEDQFTGFKISSVVDDQGNARIIHYRYIITGGNPSIIGELRYASTAIELDRPSAGLTWPVGARRTVEWMGSGLVDISLSTDGGATYFPLADEIAGGNYSLTVPNAPAAYCKVRLERRISRSIAVSDSFFQISGYVGAGAFAIAPDPGGEGGILIWSTDPGLEDLAGYSLKKSSDLGATWAMLMPLNRVTKYRDVRAAAGDRYRLYATNLLGEQVFAGETSLGVPRALTAWPLPFRKGDLNIEFVVDRPMSGDNLLEIDLFDVTGRRQASLARRAFPVGTHRLTWNGTVPGRGSLPNGLYFLRTHGSGVSQTIKVAIMR